MVITIPATFAETNDDVEKYLVIELKRYFGFVYGIEFNDDTDEIIAVVSFEEGKGGTDEEIVLVHEDGSDDDWFTFVSTDE